jgi:hypothetical protein
MGSWTARRIATATLTFQVGFPWLGAGKRRTNRVDIAVLASLQLKKGSRRSHRLTKDRSSSARLFVIKKGGIIYYLVLTLISRRGKEVDDGNNISKEAPQEGEEG